MSLSAILRNNHVQLMPLTLAHKDALFAASQVEHIWTWTIQPGMGSENFGRYFDSLIRDQAIGKKIPFVVQVPDGRVVGLTCYLNIDLGHRRLEIGSTWYHPDVWGTTVNPAAKYLLLAQAFETCEMNRVALCTDLRNLRSQKAIEKIGAQKEGILRAHMIVQNGHIRDTVLYGITKKDWDATVKWRLEKML